MAKLQLPKGMTSVSWGGNQYDATKKGVVDVPDEAVADLVVFGATGIDEPPAPPAPEDPVDPAATGA